MSGLAATVVAHGAEGPPPLTPSRLFTVWTADPVAIAVLVVVAGLYLAGVHRLRARGDRWPVGRSVAFLVGGVGTVALALLSSMGAYDDARFSVHVAQHMVLSMVSPVCFALGAPVTLALRTLPGPARGVLLTVLHSRPARVLSHPLLTMPLFAATLYGLYFTGVYEATLRNAALHDLLHLHFLVVGSLFFWPVLGIDPVPNRLPHLLRLMLVFVTLPVHAWLGVALMSDHTVIAGDYYAGLHRGFDLLHDQVVGGGILWASGDLLALGLFLAMFVQWVRAEERAAARSDRKADRAAAEAREDAELAAYNAYLQRLARRAGTLP